MKDNNGNNLISYGPVQANGSKKVYWGNKCCGVLLPTVNSPGPAVQAWSKPGSDSGHNVAMANPSSVAQFAAHWENTYGKTYPLADTRTHVERVQNFSPDIRPDFLHTQNLRLSESPQKRGQLVASIWGNKKPVIDTNPSRFINLFGERK